MKKHFKQMARKTLTASIAALLLAITLPFGSIAEDVTERHACSGGVLFDSDEVFMKMRADNSERENVSMLRSSLPASVDLSTSPYFPPIANQGRVGSCVAFSTVYYQFTYEANKLNGVTTTAENAYSPQWPFYYLREMDTDGGLYVGKAYEFLEHHGALHMADNPYEGEYNSSQPLYFNTSKMREALDTRVAYFKTIPVTIWGKISKPTDSRLDEVKSYLASGKVLQASSDFDFDEGVSKGDVILYRFTAKNPGHSVVVVGYDDNKSYDVNRNGIIEECEKGAFKIANSWGEDFGSGGYAWVLYDALNKETTIPGNWEDSLPGERVSAFRPLGAAYNWFTAITVCNYKVDYVAELSFNPVQRNQVSPTLVKEKNGSITSAEIPGPQTQRVSSFTLVFDCFKVVSQGIGVDNKNFSLGVDLTGNVKQLLSGKITDNRGNKIADLSSVANQEGSYRAPINLMRGDVNYSGTITNADVILVTRYCSGWDNLSNIQIYLADYNGDGKVTNTDVILMQRYITNNS